MMTNILDIKRRDLLHSKGMNGIRKFFGLALWILAVALLTVRPAAAVDNVMFDVDYNWQMGYSSVTSVTSAAVSFNPLLPLGQGYFIGGSTPNVVGYDFQFLPVGAAGSFSISQTTQTFSNFAKTTGGFQNPSPHNLWQDGGSLAPVISTSAVATIPAGTTWADSYRELFRAKTQNPVLNLSSLSAAATYYVIWTYGVDRRP